MRVLHLLKTADGAGWALRQIAVLRAMGVEVAVALPSAGARRAAEYRALGVEVVEADLDFTVRRPWRLGPALARCRRLVAAVQPDLIHSHFVSTTLVMRLALGRHHPIPRLFQVPGILHLEHAAFRALDRATSGPRDHWIASCRWTEAAYHQLGIPAGRVALSYYGTDLAPFAHPTPGTLRADIGAPPDARLVGMVAWMYAPKRFLGQRRGVKGHEDFLDALPRVRAQVPGTRGVVVGGPWAGATRYAHRLRRRAGDGVHFAGVRTDVARVYADLEVAVHPSLSENCGGAVESLAVGCPTVATAVGGLPDVVVDGETGWLVPPRDPVALAWAVRDALAHPREAARRARAGRARVAHLFDVRRTGAEVAALYRRVLAAAPAAAVPAAPKAVGW